LLCMTVKYTWPHALLFVLVIFAVLHLSNAGREGAEDIFHPGHEAVHVMRLHRYEHNGRSSFLQAESDWHSGVDARQHVPDRDRVQRHRRGGIGTTLGHDVQLEHNAPSSFLRVSTQQAAALKEHQNAALIQVEEKQLHASETQSEGLGTLRMGGKFLKYHSLVKPGKNKPAVTGLSALSSQYVGQVSVGSVLHPAGCQPSTTESLIYIGDSEDGTSNSSQGDHACGVKKDQAKIWMVFDTGSTNIWVASDLCKEGPCADPGRSRYDHTKSYTYKQSEDSSILQIEFGTGRIVGPKGIDDFHIGPFTVYAQTFGMIQKVDGRVFEEVQFEGILGLAFQAMSANGVRSFMQGIIENKALERNEFAFYFSPNVAAGNALLWGGVDPNFYTGDIMYFPVVEPYYWSLELLDFKIGEDSLIHLLLPKEERGSVMDNQNSSSSWLKSLHQRSSSWLKGLLGDNQRNKRQTDAPFKVIVDSGTTFFTAQGDLYPEVMRRLPAADCSSLTKKSHPDLTYVLRNAAGNPHAFVISSDEYMVSSEGEGSKWCTPPFMHIEVPIAHGPAMVFGEVWMRIYFSVFDRGPTGTVDEARIGFGAAVHDAKAQSHLKELLRGKPSFGQQ